MKWIACALAVLLVLSIAGCAALGWGEDYPSLRPHLRVPEGYTLVKEKGVDFDVWQLAPVGPPDSEPSHGLGFYVGLHPQDIEGVPPVRKVRGQAAGQSVTWFEWSDEGVCWRQTQLKVRPSLKSLAVGIDLWVWGQTTQQVEAMSALARELRFRESRGGT